MGVKSGFIFLGFIFIVEAIWALFGGKIYFKYQGWQIPDEKTIFGLLAIGLFFICIGIFYKPKYPELLHCKKCKKVYNYVDVKDKNGICPKCKGELQDYKEFENKNREFQKLDKIEKEFTKKSKN
ncbi:adenylate kinase [Campylobacter gastrosuis]|uniref:Endonuclease Q family protein n=1 Tax=Campylobacter gastrosuis TaxID=2974576 RepID=A0ABT7HSB5_9BACT|nr:adenylate kinase [Campylobacter gastrosuis]MDL0089303.1 endonuclease Q family protein [Campylobacter gastrosuis]